MLQTKLINLLKIIILTQFMMSCATMTIKKSKPPICNFTIIKIDETNYKICEAELKEFLKSYLLYYDGLLCEKF